MKKKIYTYTYKTRDSDDQFSPRIHHRVTYLISTMGSKPTDPIFATMRATKETEMNKR